mmetsp:Transcript_21785/g.36708  ORF Transcript_21785/g.36708 Transcript_21785/m.36708 type:complete len:159 (-) Transcript_21785:16-492(-)
MAAHYRCHRLRTYCFSLFPHIPLLPFYCRENLSNHYFFQFVHPLVGLLIAVGMLVLTLFAVGAACTNTYHQQLLLLVREWEWEWAIPLLSRHSLQVVLMGTHLVHVYEASRANAICTELGVCSGYKRWWVMQTFFFGIGSLSILHSRQEFMQRSRKRI